MNKIIVTGGNGFIGSNLIKYLIKKNYFVINIDKNTYSKKSYILENFKKKITFFLNLILIKEKKLLVFLRNINPKQFLI